MLIKSVSDMLSQGIYAIVLCTDGKHLTTKYPDGSGESGNWVISPGKVIDPTHPFDKVVVYKILERAPRLAEIYLANYTYAEESPTLGQSARRRYVIHFQDAQLRGLTNRNWTSFAGPGQNPVRYINKG